MLAGCSIFIVGLGMAQMSFHWGRALGCTPLTFNLQHGNGHQTEWVLLLGCLVLGILLIVFQQGYIGIGILTGMVGTWTRFYLSKYNLPDAWIPWGTLMANVIGTGIGGLFWGLQQRFQWSKTGVEMGIFLGFCGCLTTVSTLIKELNEMPIRQSLTYLTLSCVPSLFLIALLVELIAHVY
jgi:fluoride ion exporter CrcB/FEX